MSVHTYPDGKHCKTEKEVKAVYYQVNDIFNSLEYDQLGTILSACGVVPVVSKRERIKQLTVLLQLR